MTNSPIKKILVTFIKIMSLNSEGIGAEVMSHADKTVFLNCFPFIKYQESIYRRIENDRKSIY